MKITLLTPSNIAFMPYINNYLELIKGDGKEVSIINWDRLRIEPENQDFVYRDKKNGQQRGFYAYYGYSKYVEDALRDICPDFIICFTIQLAYFLRRYLSKEYANRYIIDIRDYHQLVKLYDFKKTLKDAALCVISSSDYTRWLPGGINYINDHNILLSDLDKAAQNPLHVKQTPRVISCIGSLRDFKINIELIESLKGSTKYSLSYNGSSKLNDKLIKYIEKTGADNVAMTGFYNKQEEESLYIKSTMINVLRYPDGINNITALPNRLYNALINNRPLLAYKGTYLSKLVQEYEIGYVTDNFYNFDKQLDSFFDGLEEEKWELSRKMFLDLVRNDKFSFRASVLNALTRS